MDERSNRDRLLIRNVVEWIAEKYVEDDRLGPDVFATLLHECEEDGLVKTFYEKMIELADKGETYLAGVRGHDGETPLILIQGGKTMLEVKAYKLDYKKLNKKCAYCDAEATMIRITTLTDGTLRVSTMCDYHAEGEKQRAFIDGFRMAGESSIAGAVTDATLIDENVLQEMKQAAIELKLGFEEK